MICSLCPVTPEQADAILAAPDSRCEVVHDDMAGVFWLDKGWDAVHFMLTGVVAAGDWPLSFIQDGGNYLGDESGEGGRYLSPAEVAEVAAAVGAVPEAEFIGRFDPAALDAAGVYPGHWAEQADESREWLAGLFTGLKQHLRRTAEAGHGLLITIG